MSASNNSYERVFKKPRTARRVTASEINNSLTMISKISNLLIEKVLSDVTLVIGGTEYPAHRLILCASSDVFSAMLMSNNWGECQRSRVELVESPECALVFNEFINYIYTGRVKLHLYNALYILMLADKYNVEDLIVSCVEYLENRIPAAADQCFLIEWFKYFSLSGHNKLYERSKNFIKWNFESVAKCSDFCSLDPPSLLSILSDDDIVVSDEYSLYLYVDEWIQFQRHLLHSQMLEGEEEVEDKMYSLVKTIIAYIRFPMMSPRQLADLLLVPLTQSYKELLMEQMSISMAYHSGVTDRLFQMVLDHPNRSKLFTARLYCTEQWSIGLTIDSFKSLNHYHSKTIVFSTALSMSEKYFEKQVEWVVDFYPKGVHYKKFLLIFWQRTLECPEVVLPTVRLSIHCKGESSSEVRASLSVLISGQDDEIEHIRSVSKRNYIFSGRDRVLNLNDIIPYNQLIPCAKCSLHPHSNSHSNTNSNSNEDEKPEICPAACVKSPYLVGSERDTMKIRIVITPMNHGVYSNSKRLLI